MTKNDIIKALENVEGNTEIAFGVWSANGLTVFRTSLPLGERNHKDTKGKKVHLLSWVDDCKADKIELE